ncbi:MAG: 3-phosphoshikimate 1-carboxyvinyltransferase [Desulfovibrionaceae bacterium]|nr:3-phosphoshikimate 1-carboxyvinyltransferase [Desulfovibrionaceae bacterium]
MNKNILLVPGKLPSDTAARVQAPSSKSISHRNLVAAALATGRSRLRGALESEDTAATAEILRGLGAEITREGSDILINGLGGQLKNEGPAPLLCDVHESGTTCRLLTAVLAAGQGEFKFTARGRMNKRPMLPLTSALEKLGTKFEFEHEAGYLPFIMRAAGLPDTEVHIDTSQSSQYLSGLLLAAPLGRGMKLVPTAEAAGAIVSWSYVQLTLQTMAEYGIKFSVEERDSPDRDWREVNWRSVSPPKSGLCRICVEKGSYKNGNYEIEGDFSNASYLLAAGAVGLRPIIVDNLSPASLQGDREIVRIIEQMGGRVRVLGRSIEVSPPEKCLQGIEVNMGDCPDLVPTVAAMAAFAKGPTRISGVEHLRLKESDRIAAPAAELAKVGCKVQEEKDGMIITPPLRPVRPALPFQTYNDHRMAMSMALFSCAGFDVQIENPACVSKSFPDFWEIWEQI